MQRNIWSDVIDGTAIGPSAVINLRDGEATITALWDDERGVQIEFDIPPLVVTRDELHELRDLCDRLLATPAPKSRPTLCASCVTECWEANLQADSEG